MNIPLSVGPRGLHDLNAIRAAAEAAEWTGEHVLSFCVGRRVYWVKRPEVVGLRKRIQKGSGEATFAADRRARRFLSGAGFPVVPVLIDTPAYIVSEDAGATVASVIASGPDAASRAALQASSRLLARLHGAGYCHGRPSPKDICWTGFEARLLDLERFRPDRTGEGAFATDLVIFAFGAVVAGADGAALSSAMEAYDGPPGVKDRARRKVRRLRFLGPLSRLVTAVKPGAREWAALPRFISLFR